MSRDIDTLIRRISPVSDAEAVGLISDETSRDLTRRITATSPDAGAEAAPPARDRRRLVIGLPLAAGLAGAAVAATVIIQSGAVPTTPSTSAAPRPAATSSAGQLPNIRLASALTFTKRGGHLEVRVRDPLADPQRFREEFAKHGLQIQLSLVAGSPSIVGTVVMIDGPSEGPQLTAIEAKGACETGGGGDRCPVGVRVPLDFRGKGGIVFARAARPGEQYASTAPVNAPGEAMHGMAFRNRTVAEVRAMLDKRGVTVPEYRYLKATEGAAEESIAMRPDQVRDTWYVHDGVPWAKDQVLLFIGPEPERSGD